MKERYGHLRRLGRVLDATRHAYAATLQTVVEALPANHARAYRACQSDKGISADYFIEWEYNQAADTLRELYEFGLLIRYQIDGRYIYKMRKVDEDMTPPLEVIEVIP